jgi:hypothetical protein
MWENRRKRFYVIELPDRSHTRIPLHWADDVKAPLPEIPLDMPVLTVRAVRELSSVITIVKASKIE